MPPVPEALAQALEKFSEVAVGCERALGVASEVTGARDNLNHALVRLVEIGDALRHEGSNGEAIACYRVALRHDPDCAAAHLALAHSLLLTGNFEQGWEEFEWRWRAGGISPCPFSQPLWDGSPIEGRTILLWAEQGLGDTIQFIRYAALLERGGARVVVECQPGLAGLLETVPGVEKVVPFRSPLPDFDVQAPLQSLPRILCTRLETIPAQVPYLSADPELVERWGPPIAAFEGFKVGLTWAGNPSQVNDRARSLTLAQLAPLARIPGVALFGLQLGLQAAELHSPPPGLILTNLVDESSQISDTAAIIMNLDLVISVDTMVAHLAGALGRPAWTLLSFSPSDRWLLGREDSPWYPTMRLFRQPRPGDWQSVLERVAEALKHAAPS